MFQLYALKALVLFMCVSIYCEKHICVRVCVRQPGGRQEVREEYWFCKESLDREGLTENENRLI